MESTLRRTWAEIDLDALAHNYHKLRERIGADAVSYTHLDVYKRQQDARPVSRIRIWQQRALRRKQQS